MKVWTNLGPFGVLRQLVGVSRPANRPENVVALEILERLDLAALLLAEVADLGAVDLGVELDPDLLLDGLQINSVCVD